MYLFNVAERVFFESSEEQFDASDTSEDDFQATAVSFAENAKAQKATRVMFELVHSNGDILREVRL